jgi:hypothetical protein
VSLVKVNIYAIDCIQLYSCGRKIHIFYSILFYSIGWALIVTWTVVFILHIFFHNFFYLYSAEYVNTAGTAAA